MNTFQTDQTVTAFHQGSIIARGALPEVAPRILAAQDGVLVFDDRTGRIVDLDPRDWTGAAPHVEPERKRGRPKLGVTPREVTLLPRHWEWLFEQPGGASATLRRLVEAARRADEGRTDARQARDAAYRVMHALAGDLEGFEEASRALFAGDTERLAAQMMAWPTDIAAYVLGMLRA